VCQASKESSFARLIFSSASYPSAFACRSISLIVALLQFMKTHPGIHCSRLYWENNEQIHIKSMQKDV